MNQDAQLLLSRHSLSLFPTRTTRTTRIDGRGQTGKQPNLFSLKAFFDVSREEKRAAQLH